MALYRKLPVEIQAVQWTGGNLGEILEFTSGQFEVIPGGDRYERELSARVWDELHLTWVSLRATDWIIRGVKGEFYPCADAVFRVTYEAV